MVPSIRLIGALASLLLLLGTTGWADHPGSRGSGKRPGDPPPPPPEGDVRVINWLSLNEQPKLEGERADVVAKIVIPRKVLLQLLGQKAVAPGAAPNSQPNRSEAPIGGTVIAGLCLAAAMVAAGMAWKRTTHRRTIAGAAILLALLSLVPSGFADFAPRPQPTKVIDNHPDARSKVVLQVLEGDGAVQLILKR